MIFTGDRTTVNPNRPTETIWTAEFRAFRAAAMEERRQVCELANRAFERARGDAFVQWSRFSRDPDAPSFRASLIAIAAAQREIICRTARRTYDEAVGTYDVFNSWQPEQSHNGA